jgi:hypothetical protein
VTKKKETDDYVEFATYTFRMEDVTNVHGQVVVKGTWIPFEPKDCVVGYTYKSWDN